MLHIFVVMIPYAGIKVSISHNTKPCMFQPTPALPLAPPNIIPFAKTDGLRVQNCPLRPARLAWSGMTEMLDYHKNRIGNF